MNASWCCEEISVLILLDAEDFNDCWWLHVLALFLWSVPNRPVAFPRALISEVSAVTLRYSADHLIPVYESADIGPYLARRRMEELHDPTLITPKERIHSRFSSYLYPQHQPMYWRVSPGSYLTPWVRKFGLCHAFATYFCVSADALLLLICYSQAWSGFNFDPDFFLKTTTFKRILYLEADATNEEDSLSLGQRARDLTIQAASQVNSLAVVTHSHIPLKLFVFLCRVYFTDKGALSKLRVPRVWEAEQLSDHIDVRDVGDLSSSSGPCHKFNKMWPQRIFVCVGYFSVICNKFIALAADCAFRLELN